MSITRHEIFDKDMCRKHNDIGGAAIDILRYVDVQAIHTRIIPKLKTVLINGNITGHEVNAIKDVLKLLDDIIAYVGLPRE